MTYANVHWMRRERLVILMNNCRLYRNSDKGRILINKESDLDQLIKLESVWMSWV